MEYSDQAIKGPGSVDFHMSTSQRCPQFPSDWETDRDDEFRDVSPGLVEAYDGTRYRDPEMHVLRFENTVQLIRYLHHETGRPVDELWDEYERGRNNE